MKQGIYLDNDEMWGHGPETVTFHSPPEGSYQVVVHVYNQKTSGVPESLQNAQEALVKVYIGDTVITCAAKEAKSATTGEKAPNCKSSIWKVFDIQVTETERTRDKMPIYRFTFDDSSPSLVKDLPSTGQGVTRDTICYGGCTIPDSCRHGIEATSLNVVP